MRPKSPLIGPLQITLVDGEIVFLGAGGVNFSMTPAAARATSAALEALLNPATDRPRGNGAGQPIILVVEDEAIVRQLAVELLQSAGYAVIEAENAAEALEALESGPEVHLMFTDIQMPGALDGLQLAHLVNDRWPRIHLLISSGRSISAELGLPTKGRFLSKPYEGAAMLRHVSELFAA